MEVIITFIAAILLLVTLTVYIVRFVWIILTDLASSNGYWSASAAFLLIVSAVAFISYIT